MGKVELYAELLTNIRTVTLVATLQTESNLETRVELSGDGQTITITHEGMSASLRLPTRMGGGGTAALTLPPTSGRNLTLRLKVEETEAGFLTFEHADENLVPWSAVGMQEALGVRCRRCGASVVNLGKIESWRDLPSENWAEMMDFWHCHRPREHEPGTEENDALLKKGYAASNKLRATEGVAHVGLSYFLLSKEDCENVKIHDSLSDSKELGLLQCTSCTATLGIVDPETTGWKIHKWSLSIKASDSTVQSFPVQKWISTQLLALVESSGVRRFVVQSSSGSPAGLVLWLFTDSLSFSSSHNFWARRDPTRAMKIMWKEVEKAKEMVDSHQFSHEHVYFPDDVFQTLSNALEQSALLMPQVARKWQEWKVGLLERFGWEDVHGSDARVLPEPRSPREPQEQTEEEEEREQIRKLEGSAALFE